MTVGAHKIRLMAEKGLAGLTEEPKEEETGCKPSTESPRHVQFGHLDSKKVSCDGK
jgi:hypothetical protein